MCVCVCVCVCVSARARARACVCVYVPTYLPICVRACALISFRLMPQGLFPNVYDSRETSNACAVHVRPVVASLGESIASQSNVINM